MTNFVELHMIQNFAPSNLNRDDTGNPKDCVFGGVRRARISSQCLKRAMRNASSFAEATKVANGVRTKHLVNQVSSRLPEQQQETGREILAALAPKLYSKLDGKSQQSQTAVLLYLSHEEMTAISDALLAQWNGLADEKTRDASLTALAKDLAKRFKGRTSAPDIALFGRMLAEVPELNIDAACQVAHALSTHRVAMEMDFYTAVDDLKGADSAGAGMMGFTGYDSACFYRYMRLDWNQLVKNLDGNTELARNTVDGFIQAAIDAVPSGKQNTFAAYNPPSLVMAVVRSGGMGWSLANAFENPVRSGQAGGYVVPSVEALAGYWARLNATYGSETVAGVSVLAVDPDLTLNELDARQVPNRKALTGSVLEALTAQEATQ